MSECECECARDLHVTRSALAQLKLRLEDAEDDVLRKNRVLGALARANRALSDALMELAGDGN